MKLPQSLLSKLAVGSLGLALSVGCSVQNDAPAQKVEKAPIAKPKVLHTPENPAPMPVSKDPTIAEKKTEKPECKVDPNIKQSPDRPEFYCPGCGRG